MSEMHAGSDRGCLRAAAAACRALSLASVFALPTFLSALSAHAQDWIYRKVEPGPEDRAPDAKTIRANECIARMAEVRHAMDNARQSKIDPATVADVWGKAKEACEYIWSAVFQQDMDKDIKEMAGLSEKQAHETKGEDPVTATTAPMSGVNSSVEELTLDAMKGSVPCKLATTAADAYQLDNDVEYKKWPRECMSKDIAISIPVLDHHIDRIMVDCRPNLDNPWLRPDKPGEEDFYMLAFLLRNPSATKTVTVDVDRFALVMRDAGTRVGTSTGAESIEVARFERRKTDRIFCNPFPIVLKPKERFVAQLLFTSTKHVPWRLHDQGGGTVIDITRAYVKEYNGYCGRDHGAGPVVDPKKRPDVDTDNDEHSTPRQPPPPEAVGVFAGSAHYVDKKVGQGCVAVNDRDLTLTVDAVGNVTWSGTSALDLVCSGEAAHPTTCAHSGSGTLSREGSKLILKLDTTGSRGVSMSGLDKHVWQCGNVRIEVPSTVTLGGSCVQLGIGEPDRGEVAATNTACRVSKPWESLGNASIKIRGRVLDLPQWGGRRRLLLKNIGTIGGRLPVPE